MEQRERDADAVLIGSALGGLVGGAILARHGKRVVVLEHADTVGAWVTAHAASASVRRAVLLMAAVVFHSHPEEASAGRFMQFLRRRAAGSPSIPDDDEVGGMQGLIEPWARAIRTHGGEIALS